MQKKPLSYKNNELLKRMIQWFIFTVVITLAPIILSYLLILMTKQNPQSDLIEGISPKGELLIAATAIFGDATSDLFTRTRAIRKHERNVLGGICIVGILATSFLYAGIQNQASLVTLNQGLLADCSVLFFCSALAFGFVCKL